MNDYPDSFADYPHSVGEKRSERDRSSAAWTPRDVLVDMLRQIDSGTSNPEHLAIVWQGDSTSGWSYSGSDITTIIGALCTAQVKMSIASSRRIED